MAGPFVVGRNRAVIATPPQQVFDYLADLTRHGEWNAEEGFRVTAQPEGQPGVGSIFRRERTGEMQPSIILRGGMGAESRATMVKITAISVYRPCQELVLETSNSYNGLLHSVETMAFSFFEEPEGVRVVMVAQVEAMVPGPFIGPVYAIRIARAVFDRLFGRRLARLFPDMTVGPYLSRIKEMMETGKITSRL